MLQIEPFNMFDHHIFPLDNQYDIQVFQSWNFSSNPKADSMKSSGLKICLYAEFFAVTIIQLFEFFYL